MKGIEPSYSAWKAAALPLSYTRKQPVPTKNNGRCRIRTYVGVSQRIYSPSPLATRATSLFRCMRSIFESRRRDLNPRPADYKSAALPLSYTGKVPKHLSIPTSENFHSHHLVKSRTSVQRDHSTARRLSKRFPIESVTQAAHPWFASLEKPYSSSDSLFSGNILTSGRTDSSDPDRRCSRTTFFSFF